MEIQHCLDNDAKISWKYSIAKTMTLKYHGNTALPGTMTQKYQAVQYCLNNDAKISGNTVLPRK